MNALNWIESFFGTIQRLKDGAKRRVSAAIIASCGVLLVFCAVGFGIAAGYMRLAVEMPPYIAALYVAGGLVLIGGIIVAAGVARSRPPETRVRAASSPDLTRQAEETADRAVQEAVSQVQRNPASTLLTALAIGVVVGLLRPRREE